MTRQLAIQKPFNLEITLMMGQAFRWRELPPEFYGDGRQWFSGVIGDNLFHIRRTDAGVEYRVGDANGECPSQASHDETLRRYFREDDDITAIYAHISRDPKMAAIIEEHPGLRLLRQDPWECIAAYLCSANNSVKRITQIVAAIGCRFGNRVQLGGDVATAFPQPHRLLADPELAPKLGSLNLGLDRSRNIVRAAERISNGELDVDRLRNDPYQRVLTVLMEGSRHKSKANGIGPKVADCIALFSLDQLEAFPVDTWVWRAITEAYPEWGFPETANPTEKARALAADHARRTFGQYAGYANQYLFYWRRLHGEKPLSFAHRWHGKLRLPIGKTVDDVRHEYLSEKYLAHVD